MAEAYLKDQRRIIPVCTWLEGEFGINELYFGVPAVIGANGVEKVVTFELTADEKAMVHKSVESVQKTIAETKL
jgi:malate dehydrogenase